MIRIKILYDKCSLINGFRVSGHAGAAAKGEDIVCAAVSAVTQALIISMEQIVKADISYEINEGYLLFNLSEQYLHNNDCQLLLRSMVCSLINMKKGYSQYISIKHYINEVI